MWLPFARTTVAMFGALAFAARFPSHAEGPPVPSAIVIVDYWPGKYVKLPASIGADPGKLTYVTIKKANGEYEIEGFEGRKFRLANFDRSLSEIPASSILTKPLAYLGMGTATLQAERLMQIVIDVRVGDERFYLVRAEPLRQ